MKKIIFAILMIIIVSMCVYFYFIIGENRLTIIREQETVSKLDSTLEVINDSLKLHLYKVDSLDAKLKSIEEEKRKIIRKYEEKKAFVDEMNKQYMKSIDQNGDGIPDNIEIGDYNGNGIPDAVER